MALYDCHYGEQYKKPKEHKARRLRLQSTRKIGCFAHIKAHTYRLYSEYKTTDTEYVSSHKLRQCKENLLRNAKEAIKAGKAISHTKHFVSLPMQCAHSGHPVDVKASFCQRVNPIIVKKIGELVSAGIVETGDVQKAVNYFVKYRLPIEHGIIPLSSDRAFYPLPVDIRNHVRIVKRALELSKLDWENLQLKVEEWEKGIPQSFHYFRPYTKPKQAESQDMLKSNLNNGSQKFKDSEMPQTSSTDSMQSLLWVHQEKWQKELLVKYGNTITLIDTTYKTTKYELALFFLCVPTNVNYTVVAEFVTQSETAENIAEALSVIKQWNVAWSPPFFMTDNSEAEQLAITNVFADCEIYLCDFHREQCWERWVKDHNHNLTKDEADTLLFRLRECANAPSPKPTESFPQDHDFKLAVEKLKQSSVWINNKQVSQ